MQIKKQPRKSNQVANTMNVNLATFDIFCRYIVSDPEILRLANVSAMKDFINSLDPETYRNDPEKLERVTFIQKAIEARLQYNLTDRRLIINHVLSKINFNPTYLDLNKELTIDEIQWASSLVEESSKYGFMNTYIDRLLEVGTEFKTTSYDHRGTVINKFQTLLHEITNEFRRAEIDNSLIDMEFSLANGKFEEQIEEIYKVVTNPSRRLVCGMQGLNLMTGGGFEAGRVYMLLGVTGVGKSVTLLNLAYQLKKYNPNYQLKDKTKIPCIVYLTMENTVVETVTRLFDMVTESQYGMGNYSLDEVISKLRNEGQLVLNDNSPINIIIKYKANRSVDTSYLYTLTDDLHDKGYETICIIQDHLLRIRSVYSSSTSEPRFELGNIVNEFKSFAAAKDIPVISNFHLNRDAMKEVEKFANKATNIDVTQRLGKSNVSESVLILNNTDCAIIINKDYDTNGSMYMAFNIVKMRDKPELMYFAQPFAFGSGIRLVEDFNGPAMYETRLRGNHDMGDARIDNVRTSSSNVMGSLSMFNQNQDNSFMEESRYNGMSLEKDFNPFEEPEREMEIEIQKSPIKVPFTFVSKPDNIISLDDLRQSLAVN